MSNNLPDGNLERAAQRASARPFFLARDLSDYKSLHQMDDARLAEFLGCSSRALSKLALCRRPDAMTSSFRTDVERIAAYAGICSGRLVQLLREVDSISAFKTIPKPSGAVRSAGHLMAARDRDDIVPATEEDTSHSPLEDNQQVGNK